jgi:hypothetical protein
MIVEGIHINGIYQHWKRGDFYRVQEVAFDEDTGEARVIYYRCDENGIYQSIRLSSFGHSVQQPFSRLVKDFIVQFHPGIEKQPIHIFKYIKTL